MNDLIRCAAMPGRTAVMCLMVLLLTACAGMGKPPEAAVQERAQERLDLLLAGEIEEAYEFLSPGYRSGVTLNDYRQRMLQRRMQWTEATAGESDCSEDACKVQISIGYAVFGAVPGVSRFESRAAAEEDWVRVNGQWYLVPSS